MSKHEQIKSGNVERVSMEGGDEHLSSGKIAIPAANTHTFLSRMNMAPRMVGIQTQDERQVGRGRDFAHWVRRRASLSYRLGCSVRSGKPPPTDACLRLDMKHEREWAGLARLHFSLLSGFPSASWAHHRLSSCGATLFMNSSGRVVSLCSVFSFRQHSWAS